MSAAVYRLAAGVLLALVWGFLPVSVQAAFPPTMEPGACYTAPCYSYKTTSDWDGIPRNIALDACKAALAYRFANNSYTANNYFPPGRVTLEGVSCGYYAYPKPSGAEDQFGGTSTQIVEARSPDTATCPANSTLTGGQCVCNTGFNEQGGQCVAPTCPQGQVSAFRPTTGWGWYTGFNSDGLAIIKGAPGVSENMTVAPTTICDGSCVRVADGAGELLIAEVPSGNGMHRIAVEQDYMTTGATCSATSPDLNPSITPPCPGALGQVGDKTVCLAAQGGSGTSITPGASITPGTSTTSTGTPTGVVGPNGELGGTGHTPNGTAGGSTGSTGGGTTVVTAGSAPEYSRRNEIRWL